MEIKDVRIGQIITVGLDTETLYKVVKILNTKVDLIKVSNDEPLSAVSCVELKLIVNT